MLREASRIGGPLLPQREMPLRPRGMAEVSAGSIRLLRPGRPGATPPACRVCDGRAAGFRVEHAHTDQPSAVIDALDRVPVISTSPTTEAGQSTPPARSSRKVTNAALRVLAIHGATLPPKPSQARGIVRKLAHELHQRVRRFRRRSALRLVSIDTGGIVGYAETSGSIKRSSLAISWSDWHAGQFLRVRA